MLKGVFLSFIALLCFSCAHINPHIGQPITPKDPVMDQYHGEKVLDEYRWLEDWDDPKVKEWSDAQNNYTRSVLDALPSVDRIRRRVAEMMNLAPARYRSPSWRVGKLFAIKYQPPLNQPMLIWLTDLNDPTSARTILDLNSFDPDGRTSIDWYQPSPDGKMVGVSLSVAGTEEGDLHLFETETGKQIDVIIPHVNGGTDGGDMAWLADGSGFYYTRYPGEGEKPEEDRHFYQQVWYHELGTPVEKDHYVIGQDFPRIAEIRLEIQHPSNLLMLTVQYGDGGTFAFYLVKENRQWRQLARYEDEIVEARFGPGNSLYLLSFKEAPHGKLMRLDLKAPELKNATVLIPENEYTIISKFGRSSKIIPMKDYLYIAYQLGGPSDIFCYTYEGKKQAAPETLPISTIGDMIPMKDNQLLFSNYSYLKPKTWYQFRAGGEQSEVTTLSSEAAVDYSNCEVLREFAISKDGTKVPVNIIKKKDVTADGSNPAILYGYGGYGISQTPSFSSLRKVWLEQGGIYAIANIRGGGEFGEEWHEQGMLTNKQNVFDDFAAAMQYLIDEGYTNPKKLAIRGGSNGGLLMGAIITQHPELFAATVSTVGIYDMIRVELSPNGEFNIPEFGTVENPEQFRALYAYSPYHQVEDGTAYPAVLFMTGANDPRVDPMQSRKMTARLQRANSSDNPVLLRTSSETGHGGGTPLSEKIEEYTDRYTFLFHYLKVDYRDPNLKD